MNIRWTISAKPSKKNGQRSRRLPSSTGTDNPWIGERCEYTSSSCFEPSTNSTGVSFSIKVYLYDHSVILKRAPRVPWRCSDLYPSYKSSCRLSLESCRSNRRLRVVRFSWWRSIPWSDILGHFRSNYPSLIRPRRHFWVQYCRDLPCECEPFDLSTAEKDKEADGWESWGSRGRWLGVLGSKPSPASSSWPSDLWPCEEL